jgi:biotin operon repressor
MANIYCNSCGEEINVKIDYGNNPIDDMINKLKLMGYVVFKRGGSNA